MSAMFVCVCVLSFAACRVVDDVVVVDDAAACTQLFIVKRRRRRRRRRWSRMFVRVRCIRVCVVSEKSCVQTPLCQAIDLFACVAHRSRSRVLTSKRIRRCCFCCCCRCHSPHSRTIAYAIEWLSMACIYGAAASAAALNLCVI